MNKWLRATLIGALAATGGWSAAGAEALVGGYAALVNNRVITLTDVYDVLEQMRPRIEQQHEGAALKRKLNETYREILENMIQRALIYEEYDRLGDKNKLSDALLKSHYNRVIHERFQSSRPEFVKELLDRRITLSEWQTGAREALIFELMRREVVNNFIAVAPRQTLALYARKLPEFTQPESAHIGAIVLKSDGTRAGLEEQKQAGRAICGRLAAPGGDFAAEAKKYSQGFKADQGGDWGWIETRNMRPELGKVIRAMQRGETSPIFVLDNEVYILKLVDYRPAQTQPLAQVLPSLTEDTRHSEYDRLFANWMERLKARHHVHVFLPDRPI